MRNNAGPQFAWLAGLDDPEQYPLILDDTLAMYEVWQNAMADIQEHKAIDTGLRQLLSFEPHARHLSDLARVIPNEALRTFFERLKGSFLDAAVDNLDFSNAAVRYWAIEYGTLGIDNTRWVSPFIAFVQRRAFAAFAKRPGEARIITIDEGARSMKAHRMREFAERIDREGRKHLTSLIIATQSAAEVINSPIAPVLKEQTATRICARTPAVRDPETRKQYREVGFTEEQVSLLPDLDPFSMLIANDNGHQIATLRPVPLEMAVYAGASEEDHQLVDAAIETGGARWFPEYCASRPDLPDMSDYIQGLDALDAHQPTQIHREAYQHETHLCPRPVSRSYTSHRISANLYTRAGANSALLCANATSTDSLRCAGISRRSRGLVYRDKYAHQHLNQRLAAINQLAGIQAQVQMMMRYPQQVHGNPFQAWNGLMSVAGSAPGFYNSTYGADRSSLKTLTSSLQSQTPAQQNNTISNNTQGEAGVSLAAAFQLLQADSNTAPTIANIQSAAAQAKSPLQIEQLTMQLLVMLMAQLSRMQQLSAQQLNQDASNAVLTNAQANVQQQALLQAAQAHIESAALGGNP